MKLFRKRDKRKQTSKDIKSNENNFITNAHEFGYDDIKISNSGKLRIDVILAISAFQDKCKQINKEYKYTVMYKSFVGGEDEANVLTIPLVFSCGDTHYAVFFLYNNEDIERYNDAQKYITKIKYDKCIYFSSKELREIRQKSNSTELFHLSDLRYKGDININNEYAMWWKDNDEKSFIDSKSCTFVSANYIFVENYESIFAGLLKFFIGKDKEQSRELLPQQELILPVIAPENQEIIITLSVKTGIRFLFLKETPKSYINKLLLAIHANFSALRIQIVSDNIDKDPSHNSIANEQFNILLNKLKQNEKQGEFTDCVGLLDINKKQENQVEFVSQPITEEQIKQQAEKPKEVIVQIEGNGGFKSICKSCQREMFMKDKDELLWMICMECNRITFYPIENIKRDIGFAQKDEKPFVAELYYLKELPQGLVHPFESEENNTKNVDSTTSIDQSMNETQKVSEGEFNYETYLIENVSEKAIQLHKEARRVGEQRQYDKAIELLLEANKVAPVWPYPLYEIAYNYLLMEDFENALKYYRLTDKLAPNGFFTSKVALFTLEKENKGEFKKGLYKRYLSLEWIENPSVLKEMTKELLDEHPNYAPAWQKYALLLDGYEREEALNKGLQLECDMETYGLLIINKAIAIHLKANNDRAIELLSEVILNKNSTLGNLACAKHVLNTITPGKHSNENDLLVLQKFFPVLEKQTKDKEIKLSKASIQIEENHVNFKLLVEKNFEQNENWIFAAKIEVYINSELLSHLSSGVVGAGKTNEIAIDQCINGWLAYFGVPFAQFLNQSSDCININGFKIYSGLANFRGQKPDKWIENKQLIDILTNTTSTELSKKLNLITINIIQENRNIDGECSVNGNLSTKALLNIKQIDWPSNTNYMFKQFFLIVQ